MRGQGPDAGEGEVEHPVVLGAAERRPLGHGCGGVIRCRDPDESIARHDWRFHRRVRSALLQRDLPVIAALGRKQFVRPAADPGRLDGSPSLSEALEGFGAEVLTAREQEIATLILKGHSSRSIAELTGTTEGTVKIHRKNLYRKLRISSQSELLAMFLGSVLS